MDCTTGWYELMSRTNQAAAARIFVSKVFVSNCSSYERVLKHVSNVCHKQWPFSLIWKLSPGSWSPRHIPFMYRHKGDMSVLSARVRGLIDANQFFVARFGWYQIIRRWGPLFHFNYKWFLKWPSCSLNIVYRCAPMEWNNGISSPVSKYIISNLGSSIPSPKKKYIGVRSTNKYMNLISS